MQINIDATLVDPLNRRASLLDFSIERFTERARRESAELPEIEQVARGNSIVES